MSEMPPQTNTTEQVPMPVDPATPEVRRMQGDRGALNLSMTGLRRAVLDFRIKRLDAAATQHEQEAEYAQGLRQHVGEHMGETYAPDGTMIDSHTEDRPIRHTHHTPSSGALSKHAGSASNIEWLRTQAAGGGPVSVEGTNLAMGTTKPAIRGLGGEAIERQAEPPTRRSRRLEGWTARQLKRQTDAAQEHKVIQGELGDHKVAPVRTKVRRIIGWAEDKLDPSIGPFEAADRKSERKVTVAHVPTRRTREQSHQVGTFRGGTLKGIRRAATAAEARADKKQEKADKLRARRAKL